VAGSVVQGGSGTEERGMSELASESMTQCAWSLVPGLDVDHRAASASPGATTGAEPA
jgi:hypothetical protein